MIHHMVEILDHNILSRDGGDLQEPSSGTVEVQVNYRELVKDISFDFIEIGFAGCSLRMIQLRVELEALPCSCFVDAKLVKLTFETGRFDANLK
jgi:hypothetical protein